MATLPLRGELFTIRRGRREDQGLHGPILAAGGNEPAVEVARNAGLTDSEIRLLYGAGVGDAGFGEFEEQEHPRGPGGKFAEKPGEAISAAAEAAKPWWLRTVPRPVAEHQAHVERVLRETPPINSRWRAEVKELIEESKDPETKKALLAKIGESFWRQAEKCKDPSKAEQLWKKAKDLGFEAEHPRDLEGRFVEKAEEPKKEEPLLGQIVREEIYPGRDLYMIHHEKDPSHKIQYGGIFSSATSSGIVVSKYKSGWKIEHLFVPPNHRSKGHAQELLKFVTAEADKVGQTLTLEPYAEAGTKEDVVRLYQKFGFNKPTKNNEMVRRRQPNAKAAKPKAEGKQYSKDDLWTALARIYLDDPPAEDKAVDLLLSVIDQGHVEGRLGYGADFLIKLQSKKLTKASSDEEILAAIKSDAELYTGRFKYHSKDDEKQDYAHFDMIERLLPLAQSKIAQDRVVDKLVSMSPELLKSKDNRLPSAQLVLDTVTRSFRGDSLDRLADGLGDRMDEHSLLHMFSKDYSKFEPRFISNWLMTGGTAAYRRAYAATKDSEVNAGKSFWLGRQPLTESELVPSANMRANLEKIYKRTQDFYRKKLGKKYEGALLTVQRGVGGHADAYTPAPVESWTVDKRTPERFGKTMALSNGQYMILTTTVPVKDVLMSWESMKGVWMEESSLKGKKEIVVFGGAIHGAISVEKR